MVSSGGYQISFITTLFWPKRSSHWMYLLGPILFLPHYSASWVSSYPKIFVKTWWNNNIQLFSVIYFVTNCTKIYIHSNAQIWSVSSNQFCGMAIKTTTLSFQRVPLCPLPSHHPTSTFSLSIGRSVIWFLSPQKFAVTILENHIKGITQYLIIVLTFVTQHHCFWD